MKIYIEKLKQSCHCESCGKYIESKDFSEVWRLKLGKGGTKYSYHSNCLIDSMIYCEKFINDFLMHNDSKIAKI